MNNSQKGFALPLLIVAVLVIIGGGTYVYIKNKADQNTENATASARVVVFGSDDSIKNGQVLTPQQKAVKEIVNGATTTTTNVTQTKNCGKDMSCMVSVAPICGPASVNWTFTIDFMGKPIAVTDVINVAKTSSGKCSLTVVATDVKVDSQPAPLEIQQGLIHTKKTCTYFPKDLQKLLTNWSLGNMSSSDDELGKCEYVNI